MIAEAILATVGSLANTAGNIVGANIERKTLQEIYAESVSYRFKYNKLISKRAIIQTFSSKP